MLITWGEGVLMFGLWIRLRLDIGWSDLFAAVIYCVARDATANEKAARAWSTDDDVLVTRSLRSAFDLLLRALELPHGSVVLMSALTIPDMETVVREHGLIPRGVDVDEEGRICTRKLRKSITEDVRVVLVAHLFGGSCDMDAVAETLASHDVLLVEDCAQSFTVVGERGHTRSDVVLHSFGAIKTATALGGAVARINSNALHRRMQLILAEDPQQSTWSFFMRVSKFAALKLLSGRMTARLLWYVLRWGTSDADRSINNLCRSFVSSSLLRQLRQRPCSAQLKLLVRRWSTYDAGHIARRTALGRALDMKLHGRAAANRHNYWVYPIFIDDPARIATRLREAGFDATHQTRMTIVTPEDCPQATRMLDRILFLPWYWQLTTQAADELAMLVSRYISEVGVNRDR